MVVMLRLEGSRHTGIFAWTLGVSVEQDQAGYALQFGWRSSPPHRQPAAV
jgi:hypothetical protein